MIAPITPIIAGGKEKLSSTSNGIPDTTHPYGVKNGFVNGNVNGTQNGTYNGVSKTSSDAGTSISNGICKAVSSNGAHNGESSIPSSLHLKGTENGENSHKMNGVNGHIAVSSS